MMPNWRDKLSMLFGPTGAGQLENALLNTEAEGLARDDDTRISQVQTDNGQLTGSHSEAGGPADPGNLEGRGDAVLIVDDDSAWCEECAFGLKRMGFRPLVAQSPEEAVSFMIRHDPPIAIVDYSMPEVDGISLIHELASRAEESGHSLSFIMATGFATKDVAIDAMRASVVDFLEKPISEADLRRALQRARSVQPKAAPREALIEKIAGLSEELQRIAARMDTPATGQAHGGKEGVGAEPNPAQLKAFIRDQLRRETKRREIGGGELFGDPTWAMLLDLLLAKIDGRRVPVSSACIASGAAMSTALRLVRRLVDEDVLCRIPDESDRRRHFLEINPRFERPLVSYLVEQLQMRNG